MVGPISPPPGAGEVNTADTGYNVLRVACSLQHESQCFKYSHDDRVKDFYENTILQIKQDFSKIMEGINKKQL